MDGGALAAIGLAANILQFIDWVSHICEVGSQIRRNGITDFNLSLERTVEELEHQLGRIHLPSGTITCATKAEEVCSGTWSTSLFFPLTDCSHSGTLPTNALR
jgi:hypothetical protein